MEVYSMKKLLCYILVVTLVVSICVMGVSATSIEEELTTKFFNYCGGNNIDWNNPNISKVEPKVKIYEYTEDDNIVYFSAVACWLEQGSMEWVKEYGKWRIYSPAANSPSSLSFYIKIGDDIFSIEEAWEKGLVTDLTPVEGFSKYTIVTCIGDVITTNPVTDVPTEPVTIRPTEPTADKPTDSMDSDSDKAKSSKKKNPIKVSVKTKSIKAKTLKNKKQTIKPLTITKAQGKVTVTLVKSVTTKAIRKKVIVSKKGVITLKKGKYTNGTYKVKVEITAKGNSKFKSKTLNKTLKIKIK